jgi:hypothetical protein
MKWKVAVGITVAVLCSVALAQIQAKKTATGSEQTPQKTTAIRTAVTENNGTHVAGSPKPHAMLFPVTDDGQGDPSYTAPADDRVVDPNECATAPVLPVDPNLPVGIDIYLPCTGTWNTNDPDLPGACIGDGADPAGEYYFSDSEWIKVVIPAGRTLMYVDDCNAPADSGHAWPADPDAIFEVVTPKTGTACASGNANWTRLGCFDDNGCPNPPGSAYPYLEHGTYSVVPGGTYWVVIARWPADCTYTNIGWYRVTVRFGVACPMTCDPSAFQELEVAPGDLNSHINDGCFAGKYPPGMGAIRCNQAVCGSSWYQDATNHDEDWYRLVVPGTTNVKLDWYAKAQFPASLKIFKAPTDPNNPCDPNAVPVAQNDANSFVPCTDPNLFPTSTAYHAIIASTPPGTYYLTIAPVSDTPAGFIYTAKVTETNCTVAMGACCDATDPNHPTCTVVLATACTGATKHYWGDGTICPPGNGCWMCPPGANTSSEPVCSDGWYDTYDLGCAAGDTPIIANELVCNAAWCGTSGTFVTGGTNARDNDWYLVDLTNNSNNPIWTAPTDPNVCEARQIYIAVYAEFDAEVLIWNFLDPQNPCAGTVDTSVDVFAKAGDVIEFSYCKTKVADPTHAWGDFFVIVRPAFRGTAREIPCGSHYWLIMQCAGDCDVGGCCTDTGCIADQTYEQCCVLGGHWFGQGTECGPFGGFFCTCDTVPAIVPENEPNCGQPTDTVDGGCNYTPHKFITLPTCSTADPNHASGVCGTISVGFTDPDERTIRDLDWYLYNHTGGDLAMYIGTQFAATIIFRGPLANPAVPCPPPGGYSADLAAGSAGIVYLPAAQATPGWWEIIMTAPFSPTLPCTGGNTYEMIVASGLAGACCGLDANDPTYCVETYACICTDFGGTFMGEGVACTPTLCGPPGACCTPTGGCSVTTQAECTTPNTWKGAGTDCFPNPCVPPEDYWVSVVGGVAVEPGGTGYGPGIWYQYPGAWWNQWWPNEFSLTRQKQVTINFTIQFAGAPPVVAFNYSVSGWPSVSAPPLSADDASVVRVPVSPPITAPGTYTRTTVLPFCPRWVSVDVQSTQDFSIEGRIQHICLTATGACCSTIGTCSVIMEAACVSAGGNYYGDNIACRTGGGCPATCRGDMNCDGRITFVDIDLFVGALAGESHWTHWPCPWINADCNGDGAVNFVDIDPFVALLGRTCPPDSYGACCSPNGSCGVTIRPFCHQDWRGRGTNCGPPNPCVPQGACCRQDGACDNWMTSDDCFTSGGLFQGVGTTCPSGCANVVCDPNAPGHIPEGEPDCYNGYVDQYNRGCEWDEEDSDKFAPIQWGETVCGTTGRFHDPNGQTRADSDWYEFELTTARTLRWRVTAEYPIETQIFESGPYPEFPCYLLEPVSPPQTAAQGQMINIEVSGTPGVYLFRVAPPESWVNPPGLPLSCGWDYQATFGSDGACCDPNGGCAIRTATECADSGGTYLGDNTTCGLPNPCLGACCYADGSCVPHKQMDCTGVYRGDGTTCSPNLCPPNPCDPNDTAEGEPDCYDGYLDTFNSGCDSADPNHPVFEPILLGRTYCANSGTFLLGGNPQRDTDWFSFPVSPAGTIQCTGSSQFTADVVLYKPGGGANACPGKQQLATATAEPGQPAVITQSVTAGVYWVKVGPQSPNTPPCGWHYQLTVQRLSFEAEPESEGDE